MYEQNQPSLMNLFGTVLVFMVAAAYGFITLSTEDALWFVPTYSEQASEVQLYCSGAQTTYGAESPHLAALNERINDALSGSKNWDSLTMSDETYNYYQSSGDVVAIEFRYSKPVRVHSIYTYFSNFNRLVVPLIGRHSNLNAVFARVNDVTTAGAMHVRTTAPILDYIEANGLCAP